MKLPYDLTRDDWRARPPKRSYVTIAPSSRPGVETHHSVGTYGARNAAEFARAVQNDHLGRDWTDVFYNVGVWLDGTIIELRPNYAQSGPRRELTVCYAGNYDQRSLTDAQKVAWHLVREAARRHGVGAGTTYHGQRDRVGCPGRDVIRWHHAGYPRPGGATPQTIEDDMPAPKDWDDRDVARVQAILNNAVVKGTDKNVAWHLRHTHRLAIAAATAGGASAGAIAAELIRQLGG